MRPRSSLPGSNFRIIALAALALLTVGGSVLSFGSAPDADADVATSVPVKESAERSDDDSSPESIEEVPLDDSSEDVSAVTTTLVAEVETIDDATSDDVAPVSGVPVVVDRRNGLDTVSDGSTGGLDTEIDLVDESEALLACAPVAEPTGTSADAADVTTTDAMTTDAAATDAGAWFTDDFTGGSSEWIPLSGTWTAVDGAYVQSDGAGYDFISQLPLDLPASYRISVDMTAVDGELGGGILIGQPVLGSRRGTTLIDFTDGGSFLRWGAYDAESGQYRYIGGLSTGADFDPATTHRLAVEVRENRTLVSLDGRAIGDFEPVMAGRAGLATSLSAVAFDDLEIVEL